MLHWQNLYQPIRQKEGCTIGLLPLLPSDTTVCSALPQAGARYSGVSWPDIRSLGVQLMKPRDLYNCINQFDLCYNGHGADRSLP